MPVQNVSRTALRRRAQFSRKLGPVAALFLALLGGPLIAQSGPASLAGRVLAANGEPIGFASVVLENMENENTLTGALSAEDGRFLVQGLPQAEIRVSVSFPGYEDASTTTLIGELNDSYDLGDIQLVRAADFRASASNFLVLSSFN